jgi:N-acyl-D-amino-acid deacylase
VEEIPGIALAEGLKWDWESFPEYLDALDRIPHAIDIGAQIPHHPLRVYVMATVRSTWSRRPETTSPRCSD